MIRVGVLTLSDRCAGGITEDISGKRIQELLPADVYAIEEYTVVPDDIETVRTLLRDWASRCDVVLTTGSTGLGPRDIAPEATRSILDRECPGIAEAMRWHGCQKNPRAILSRGLAGMIGSCLVINLPGSVAGVQEGLEVLLPILEHAVDVMRTGGRH